MKENYLESRHIGLTPEDEKIMLDAIGAESMDALVRETMPSDILLPEPIELDEPVTEQAQLEIAGMPPRVRISAAVGMAPSRLPLSVVTCWRTPFGTLPIRRIRRR